MIDQRLGALFGWAGGAVPYFLAYDRIHLCLFNAAVGCTDVGGRSYVPLRSDPTQQVVFPAQHYLRSLSLRASLSLLPLSKENHHPSPRKISLKTCPRCS